MPADLSGVALAQRRALERLRSLGSERAMLNELVQTSCLLELSKLAAASLDLATFAQMAVDIIFGFFVVDGCAVVVEAPGLPAVAASAGRVGGASNSSGSNGSSGSSGSSGDPDREAVTHPLGARGLGSLWVTFRHSCVEDGAFFA